MKNEILKLTIILYMNFNKKTIILYIKMIYFFKTPPFHIQREIFWTLPIGKVLRLAERRVTQSRALPTYSAHRCRCSSIGLHSAVYAVHIIKVNQRPKAEGLSKKWVAIFFAMGSNFLF